MKKQTLKKVSVITLAALILAGCGFGKMAPRYPEVKIQLEPDPLETKGGKISYKINYDVPEKYLKKRASVVITPTIESPAGDVALTPIKLRGEKAKNAEGAQINFKNGGKGSVSGTIDFKDGSENAVATALAKAFLGKKTLDLPKRTLGEGVINTSARASFNPLLANAGDSKKGSVIIFADHNYKPEYLTKNGTIFFEVNMSNLNQSLKLNKDPKAIAAIDKLVGFIKQGRLIDHVKIAAWASPEGEISRNQNLSVERYKSAQKWFNNEIDKKLQQEAKALKVKVKDLPRPEIKFKADTLGEDWKGFEAAIEKSNIAEKAQILNIVRSQSTSEAREQKIREMTDIYKEIAEMILPPLRRAEISIVYNKNNFNDAEILEFATSNPGILSANELLYAASKKEDLKEKEAILRYMVGNDKFQTDWRPYNDLGVILLNGVIHNNGNIADAKNMLNKAKANSPSNGIVLNNLGIAEFFERNLDPAKSNFEAAQTASLNPIDQTFNLGVLKVLEGDYEKSGQMMSSEKCDYNVALLYLLQKQYDDARTSLNCIKNKTAKTYYLAAVLAARTENKTELMSNLKKAVELDSNFKAEARKDVEFRKFRSDSEFNSIVKP